MSKNNQNYMIEAFQKRMLRSLKLNLARTLSDSQTWGRPKGKPELLALVNKITMAIFDGEKELR
jgi:hypothetical protein